jgi:hypothetical protein
MKSHT